MAGSAPAPHEEGSGGRGVTSRRGKEDAPPPLPQSRRSGGTVRRGVRCQKKTSPRQRKTRVWPSPFSPPD